MTLNRMGYGAMQLAGPGVWGPPKDVNTAITVLREAVKSGYLSRRRTWLQLRRDAGTLQQSRRGSGLAADDRWVQQIRTRLISSYNCRCQVRPNPIRVPVRPLMPASQASRVKMLLKLSRY